MGRFLSRSLRFLDGIFGIQGSEVTVSNLDLGGVQLVMDVAPVAAAGRAPGLYAGHFMIDLRLEVPAEDATQRQFESFGPDSQFLITGASWPATMPLEFQFWIDRAFLKATWPDGTPNWSDFTARLFLTHPLTYPGYRIPDSGVPAVIDQTQDLLGAVDGNTDGTPTNSTSDGTRIFPIDIPQPVLFPQKSLLQLRVQNESATELVRVQANLQCRVIPTGLSPR